MSDIQDVAKRVVEVKVEGKEEYFSIDLPIHSIDGVPAIFHLDIIKYPRDYPQIARQNKYVFVLDYNINMLGIITRNLPHETFLEAHDIPETPTVKHLTACIASALTRIKDLKWVEGSMNGRFTTEEKADDRDTFDIIKNFKNITLPTSECSVCYKHTPFQTDCAHPLCAKCAIKCVYETDNGCPVCRRVEFLPLIGITSKRTEKRDKAIREGYCSGE